MMGMRERARREIVADGRTRIVPEAHTLELWVERLEMETATRKADQMACLVRDKETSLLYQQKDLRQKSRHHWVNGQK